MEDHALVMFHFGLVPTIECHFYHQPSLLHVLSVFHCGASEFTLYYKILKTPFCSMFDCSEQVAKRVDRRENDDRSRMKVARNWI